MLHQNSSAAKLAGLFLVMSTLILCLVLPAFSSPWVGGKPHTWADDESQGSTTKAQKPSETCRSATGQLYRCKSTAIVEDSQTISSPNLNGPCKVAIFDQDSISIAQDLADVLNTDSQIQAVAISQAMLESGGLIGFNTLVARLDGNGTITNETAQAIQSFVAGGGGYIGEWWGAGAALSGLGVPINFNYFAPSRFLSFTGLASDGFIIESEHPIMVTANHPVTHGLPSVFSAPGGTEFFVRAIPPFDSRLTVLATYDGYGGTNPAIMVGAMGTANVVLLFFDAIDNPNDPDLKQLWINSVKFTCLNEFDLCIQDDSSGATLRFNSTSGNYLFTSCSGLTLGGTGLLTKRGSLITLQHYASDRRVSASVDAGVNKGTASIQVLSLGRTFTVMDRNTVNNTCVCP
jgi:hypothetical protein